MGNSVAGQAVASSSVGHAVSPVFMKSLGGRSLEDIAVLKRRLDALKGSPGLDLDRLKQIVKHPDDEIMSNLFAIFDEDRKGRIDAAEFFAAVYLCARCPVVAKVKATFQLYDWDGDEKISRCEMVIMVRGVLNAVRKITRGKEASCEEMELIAEQIFEVAGGGKDVHDRICLADWLMLCRRMPEVLNIARLVHSGRSTIRGALSPTTTKGLSPSAAANHQQQRGSAGNNQSHPPATKNDNRGSGAKFRRESILKLQEAFRAMDEDQNGYLDKEEWQTYAKVRQMGGISAPTFEAADKDGSGSISIVEVLSEVYPYATDEDLRRMLELLSEKPQPSMPKKSAQRQSLSDAERQEMQSMYELYDLDGNGELTVEELSIGLAKTCGLTPDVISEVS
jgi:Ca2+-binding EF-hand superfamily protein